MISFLRFKLEFYELEPIILIWSAKQGIRWLALIINA